MRSTHRFPVLVVAFVLLVVAPAMSNAQTPYSNISAGRPLIAEDAVALDRQALDLYLGLSSFGRGNEGSAWSITPGFAYGLLPRTQIDVKVPLGNRNIDGGARSGVGGVDLSALYSFNVESRSYPAMAMRAGVLIPVGDFGPQRAHEYVRALVTRTFGWGRLHFNHQSTFGDEPEGVAAAPGAPNLSRWSTGLAVDRALPLQGLLVAAETFARRGIASDASDEWIAAVGARYQWSARTTLELGLTKGLTADSPSWAINVGFARTTSVRGMIPGLGTWAR